LRAFVNARLDKASDRHLATDVTQSTAVTASDLLQVIRSGNTTRYRTTTTTTTTVTTTTTDHSFRGGERQRIGGGVDLLLRDTTVANLGLNHQRLSLPGQPSQSNTQGTLGLTQYYPEAKANASLGLAVGSGSKSRLALAAQMALGNSPWMLNVSAYTDTRGSNQQRGVYAGLGYQWGGAFNPGTVPQVARAQLDDRLRRMSALSDGVRGVQGLGQVVKTESKTQVVTTEESVSERVVTRADDPPVVEPPVVEPPVTEPPVEPPVVDDPDLVVPAGSGWALLGAVVEVSDELGGAPISISASGLTDPKGRAIQYQASGLPVGLSIDAATGVISGVYDSYAGGGFPPDEFVVTLTARATGSSKLITKTFTLGIRDDG
jgi:hypothetical protein